MSKKIKNPIEVKATIIFDETDHAYHIDEVSVHYGVSCEYDISMRRGMPFGQNTEILNIVKDFLEEAIKQVDAHEEIPEGDSLLNYAGAPDNLTELGSNG